MNILIVNDDGIQAEGIKILTEAAMDFGKVYVVAPKTQQSAVSQGITIHEPLKIDKEPELVEGAESWSISGKPADCVKVAIEYLRLPIDVVFSGINDGPNLGTDIMYSGTVAGATEAAVINLKSAAFSTDFSSFDIAKKYIKETIKHILDQDLLAPGIVINVNFPLREFDKSLGYRYTCQGHRLFSAKYRHDNGMYWQEGDWIPTENHELTDVHAVTNGYISITPLGFDRTHDETFESLKDNQPE